jgi:hypothetical protein
LVAEQTKTLEAKRRKYGVAARVLFGSMDLFYGKERTLSKFRVLELIARMPYQAWENIAYVVVTHRASRPGFARRVYDRVHEARTQQDNEQWHLLILEELIEQQHKREGFIKFRVLPQIIAFVYYQVSWLLYVIKPAWSYALNADFEDHAQHEYAEFVAESAELEAEGYYGLFKNDYGEFDTLADLFRQIGNDERIHKEESEERIVEARFS